MIWPDSMSQKKVCHIRIRNSDPRSKGFIGRYDFLYIHEIVHDTRKLQVACRTRVTCVSVVTGDCELPFQHGGSSCRPLSPRNPRDPLGLMISVIAALDLAWLVARL